MRPHVGLHQLCDIRNLGSLGDDHPDCIGKIVYLSVFDESVEIVTHMQGPYQLR